MKNLVRRGRTWYFRQERKDPETGQLKTYCQSLHTEDRTLAAERLKVKRQQLVTGELERLRNEKNAATLAQIFEARKAIGGTGERSIYCSCQALLGMFKAVHGNPQLTAADVSTADLTPKLVRDYQDAMRRRYLARLLAAKPKATADEQAQARDQADATSHSLFKQAKNLFALKHSLITRYRERGLVIPKSVDAFCAEHALGTLTTKVYLPPDETVLEQTFRQIDQEKETKPVLWRLFWAVIAFGGRRNEVLDLQLDDFITIQGQLWIAGGRGKDRREIQLPVINWPVHPASPTVPADVIRTLLEEARAAGRSFLFAGTEHHRQDALPRLANAWLAARGWKDEKKLHALRAYIGSLLYSQDPHLAKDYLRHKSLTTTEQSYTHFFRLGKITRLQVVERPAALQAPGAQPSA